MELQLEHELGCFHHNTEMSALGRRGQCIQIS